MINTSYDNLYGQYLNANNKDRTNKRAKDKTHMSESMEYEDIRKLYAKMNGIHYGEYDEKDSLRSMANSFLNEMVFSPMSSSKELFIPQMSRSVISAAFNAAYDISDVEERVRNASDKGGESDKDNFEVEDE